jgi:hypothetical protein
VLLEDHRDPGHRVRGVAVLADLGEAAAVQNAGQPPVGPPSAPGDRAAARRPQLAARRMGAQLWGYEPVFSACMAGMFEQLGAEGESLCAN